MKKLLFVIFALTFIIACSKTKEQKPETADQQTVTTQEAPNLLLVRGMELNRE